MSRVRALVFHHALGFVHQSIPNAVSVYKVCAIALHMGDNGRLNPVLRNIGFIHPLALLGILVVEFPQVLLRIKLKNLTPGPHGLHIHETGKCEGDFTSAGAIYNPLGAKHGYLNDEGPMVGDLPNVFVGPAGEVEVELVSPFVTLNREAEETIFDADGTAFVLYEKADDYLSETDGNVGARVACGVITPVK